MTKRLRTTISVSPEVLDVFKRMAAAGNMSVSVCMGEWLADTADAAEMICLKMEEAKKAPVRVMKEMQAMMAGMSDMLDSDMVKVRQLVKRGATALAAPGAAPNAANPPFSNTGVLCPPAKSRPRVSHKGNKA